MAPPPRIKKGSGGGAMVLAAAVLAISHLLLLATHSDACSSPSSSCPKLPAAPVPSNAPSGGGKCPVSALKLGACASVLGGLVSLELGQQGQGSAAAAASPSSSSRQRPCCQLLGGLADLDAAVCLCTALRANVLAVVQLSVLVNFCGKKLPEGFQCPS